MKTDVYENLEVVTNLANKRGDEVCIINPDSLPKQTISVIEENYKYSLYRALRTHFIRNGERLGGHWQGWRNSPSNRDAFISFYRSVLDILCDLPFYINQKKSYPIRQSSYIGYDDGCGNIFLLMSILEPQNMFPHVLMLKAVGYTDFNDKIKSSDPFGYNFYNVHLVDSEWVYRASRIQTIKNEMRNVNMIGLSDENRKEIAIAERRIPGRNGVIKFIKKFGKFEQVYLHGSSYYELAYSNYLSVNTSNEKIVDFIINAIKPLSNWKKMRPEIQALFPAEDFYGKRRFDTITSRAIAEIMRDMLKEILPDTVRCIIRHGAFRMNNVPNEAYYLELKTLKVPNTQFGFFPYGLIKGLSMDKCFSKKENQFLFFYGCTHNQRLEHNYPESAYRAYKQEIEKIVMKYLKLDGKESVCGKTDNPNKKRDCHNTIHEGTESLS